MRRGVLLVVVCGAIGAGCSFDPVHLRALRDQGRDLPGDGAALDARGDANAQGQDGTPDLLQADTVLTCPPDKLPCGGHCVDPLSDQDNCGQCGKACASDQHCDQGLCCASGQVNCSGVCSFLREDEQNCGQCGKACDSDQHCDQGLCCASDQINCSGVCSSLQEDEQNCGQCDKACASDQHCDQGLCCASGLSNCNGSCVDTKSDADNCGQCGLPCVSPKTCTGGDCLYICCADGTNEQLFSQGMCGCAGTVSFGQRASLCAPGFRVCTAEEWVARRNGQAPTYNYWTDDALRYYGSNGNCMVSTSSGYTCVPDTSPMRVCSGNKDPLGNLCNWTDCGLEAYTHDYFGGCNNNYTAGALCCPQP